MLLRQEIDNVGLHHGRTDLSLGQVLMEEFVEVSLGEHMNHDREEPRPGQIMVPKGILLAQVWGKLGWPVHITCWQI